MRKTVIFSLILAACLFPALSGADCASDTKACNDAKGVARRCALTYGFRAEVMCGEWNKNVETECAKAQNTCEGGVTQTPASRRNQ
jgi:hypothetical protein